MKQNATLTAIGELLSLGNDSVFLSPPTISAPNSQITDLSGATRKIADPSKTLRPALGLERVMIDEVRRLDNEKGPNGDIVFSIVKGDDRFRCFGNIFATAGQFGPQLSASSGTSYAIEITFFGTGLNILAENGTSRVLNAFVDGVSIGDIMPDTNGIINNRNYRPNVIYQVTSGLSLGIHTVRLEKGSTTDSTSIYGFEIITGGSSIQIPSGEIFTKGEKFRNNSLTTSAYNSGFDGSPVLNGRGGRVVEYISNSGRFGKVLQQTNATAQYLTNADHTNEEVLKRYNFRQFGAGRSDDFSTLTGSISDRYFTMDDGTTLVGDDVQRDTSNSVTGEDYITLNGIGDFMSLTFVGTGLDVLLVAVTTAVADACEVFIDGVSVGTGLQCSVNSGPNKIAKVCSGLPFGTHTVKIVRLATAGFWAMTDFIMYGPKKPTVPDNAVEVQEYYLMANYSSASAGGSVAADAYRIPTGVIWKSPLREHRYTGTNYTVIDAGVFSSALYRSGFVPSSSDTGSFQEYVFWGTGFVLEGSSNGGGAMVFTVEVDGALNATGVGLTAGMSNNGGGTYTQAIGTGVPSRLEFTGLTLGIHRVKVTRTTASGLNTLAYVAGIHIICPIYYPGDDGNSNMGPSAKVLTTDLRRSPDLTKAKALLHYDGINQRILFSMNVQSVLKLGTGQYIVFFMKPFKTSVSKMAAMSANNFQVDNDVAYPNSLQINVSGATGTPADDSNLMAIIFGELADEENNE